MPERHFPTRRDLVGGLIGLTAGGLYPRTLLGGDEPLQAQQTRHQPYRYAGLRWWNGDFLLDGVNPGRDGGGKRGSEGFERYHSLAYIRRHLAGEPDPEPLLNTLHMNDLTRDHPALKQSLEMINRWAQDMTAWAKAAREDILRIEDHLGLPHGDPGDPPPVPWK